MKSIIEVVHQDGKVTITMAVDDLVFAFDNDPQNHAKVIDKDMFAESIVNELESYQTQNSKETGLTALEEFMDKIMEEASIDSDGVDWAEYHN